MMEPDFPGNSNREKGRAPRPEPQKKVERITEGDAVRRKKPLGRRIREMFVGGDAKSVWGYVFEDVLLPAARDTVADAVSQGVERMIFGEARSYSRRSGRRPEGHIDYRRMSNRDPRDRDRERDRERGRDLSRRARASHDFDEIILPTRGEAIAVIDSMFELISKYEEASVADLYDLCGVPSNYTDEKWGWVDFRGAGVQRIRNGYLLDLPRPEPLG